MRFQIEFALPRAGAYVARRLDAENEPPSNWALLGEHMIRSVRRTDAVTEDGSPRDDLFAFQLDLDPEEAAPAAGDVLHITLLTE